MSAVTGDDDPRSLVVWESAPKGMIVPISQAVARLFQFATVNPKVGGRNWLKLFIRRVTSERNIFDVQVVCLDRFFQLFVVDPGAVIVQMDAGCVSH